MASPKDTELSEQESGNSNPTLSPTPATVDSPNTDIAADHTQMENEGSDLAPMADAPTAETCHSDQAQVQPDQDSPDTAATTTSAEVVSPQQQSPTDIARRIPGIRISDEEEDSEFDDEEGADADQPGIWDSDDAGSKFPTCPGNGNNVSGQVEGLNFPSGEGYGSMVHNLEEYDLSEFSEDSPSTPALTFSERSVDASAGPITPAPTNFCHEHEAHSASVATTPATSDRGDGETRGSVTATPAGADNGSGEGSSSMTAASASSDQGDAESIELESSMPVGFERADENNDRSASSRAASAEGSSSPSQENPIQDASSSQAQATANNAIDGGENEEATATPSQDIGESAGQADAGTDQPRDEFFSDRLGIPASPIRPAPPVDQDPNDMDLEQMEAQYPTSSPTQESEEEFPSGDDPESSLGRGSPISRPLEIPETPTRPALPVDEDPTHVSLEEREVRRPVNWSLRVAEEDLPWGDDPEYSLGRESPILRPSIIPETPWRSTAPRRGGSGSSEIGEGEIGELDDEPPSEDDLESHYGGESPILQPSRRPESRLRSAFLNHGDAGEGFRDPADTAFGASADGSTERQPGGSTEDAGNDETDPVASQDHRATASPDHDQDDFPRNVEGQIPAGQGQEGQGEGRQIEDARRDGDPATGEERRGGA